MTSDRTAPGRRGSCQYVKDCIVLTPDMWASVFPDYPLKVA